MSKPHSFRILSRSCVTPAYPCVDLDVPSRYFDFGVHNVSVSISCTPFCFSIRGIVLFFVVSCFGTAHDLLVDVSRIFIPSPPTGLLGKQ